MKKLILRSPPEVILRPLASASKNGITGWKTQYHTTTGRNQVQVDDDRFGKNLTSAKSVTQTQRRFYKAAICQALKTPLTIGVKESQLELSSGEVRVSVAAAGVNFGDLLMVVGEYQVKLPPPFTPGSEMSGTVLEVASDVTALKPGMRVVGLAGSYGAFAEEVVTQENILWEIPDEMSFTDAAGFVVSYGTAMLGLSRRAKLKPGEHVLVTAAAGATGLAAVDIAANVMQAKVIGAAGSDEKCSLAKSYGAIDAINYKSENVRNRVKSIVGSGVDVVFDTVGGAIFKEALRSIAWEGRLVVVGFASGEIPSIPANHLLVKNVSAVGLFWGAYSMNDPTTHRWSVNECLKQFSLGNLKPHICKTFDLAKINEAFDYVKSRKSTGKVVVAIR